MYKVTIIMAACCLVGLTVAGSVFGDIQKSITKKERPAIVLVSFGTSAPEARKVFDYIDSKAKKRYKGYEIRWAFTAESIIKNLKKKGIVTYAPAEVLVQLTKEGYKSVIMQSLHVVPGQEHQELKSIDTSGMKVVFGRPLLDKQNDIDKAVESIVAANKDKLSSSVSNVLIGHGNDHHPEYNVRLMEFAGKFESRYHNAFVVSVEGQPGTDRLEDAKVLAKKTGEVHFIPLMIVAGDHVMNDAMGEDEDSFKSIIAAPVTTCAKPLGYNDRILDIYFSHIDEALRELG